MTLMIQVDNLADMSLPNRNQPPLNVPTPEESFHRSARLDPWALSAAEIRLHPQPLDKQQIECASQR